MAGSKYFIRVYAVTGYGQGSYSYLQKTVPPLNLRVSSAYSYMSRAGYGLQVYVYWYPPLLVQRTNGKLTFFKVIYTRLYLYFIIRHTDK